MCDLSFLGSFVREINFSVLLDKSTNIPHMNPRWPPFS